MDYAFGGKAIAVKVFVIILFIALVCWFVYSFNISLPSLKFDFKSKDAQPLERKQKNSVSQSASSMASMVKNSARQQREEDLEEEYEQEEPVQEKREGSILKDIFKTKLHAVVSTKEQKKNKEKEQEMEPFMKFSSDKPTFALESLIDGDHSDHTIDERYLVEKAQSLQEKLMEFNIPVEIKGFDIGPTVVQIKIKPQA